MGRPETPAGRPAARRVNHPTSRPGSRELTGPGRGKLLRTKKR